jgi:hypothetical protein
MNGPDLAPEQQNLLVVSTSTIRKAEKRIYSCEQCCPADAEIPFDWILDELTGSDSTVTDYILENPATCPRCCRDVFEKTLVEPIVCTQALLTISQTKLPYLT